MPYIPHSRGETKEMLKVVGVSSLQELFGTIPEKIRLKEDLKLPSGLSEYELEKKIKQIASRNKPLTGFISFTGAGCYNHFVPSAVKHIFSRSEFYTAYTPYQPEASQGTLKAIFEYQTFICNLTGMDATCASMYEGASSLAESILMSYRIKPKPKVFLPANLHPEYAETVYTYLENLDFLEVIRIPYSHDGKIDLDFLKREVDDNTSCVIAGWPNFFGIIEDLESISKICKDKDCVFIVSCNPMMLSVLEAPAQFGADIVCGDGAVLGQGLFLGGFTFGFLATLNEHLRKMPGRIVGKTLDADGREGFVLTLQAREQHIRRHKATSNICSNQCLNAIACAAYLSLLGEEGFKKAGLSSTNLAHYLYEKLKEIEGLEFPFNGDFFNEFLVRLPQEAKKVHARLKKKKKILAGVPVENFYPEIKNCLLLATTELNTKEEIDSLAESLKEVLDEKV